MTATLWAFVFAQMMMGAFDTIYHHEGTQRLAWRPEQATELRLHGLRNLVYAAMFLALGWAEPHGAWAAALMVLMAGEMLITLWDFVEEDRSRHLPATERVTHTLLTLNYGVILTLLIPVLWNWARLPTALPGAWHGLMSWFCLIASVGVVISGLRDLAAARRCPRLVPAPAAALAEALMGRWRILVTGGTGFIGSRLVEALAAAGHEVTVLTRDPAKAAPLAITGRVRVIATLDAIAADEPFDAVVNLAGEPISDTPWTRAKRIRIVRSRLAATYALLRLMHRLERKPGVFVSGSAIGAYGLRDDEELREGDAGTPCFSRRVCLTWERAARRAEAEGVRTVLLRTGLVLDGSGGMLARMLAPFEFGLGGRFGDGRHWMSWIHRDDLVRMIVHALATPALCGPMNGTAPQPVTNRQFTAALGRALRRPALIPIPGLPLRLALGAFAEELLLAGQRVLPGAALASGFRFLYPDIDTALAAITGRLPARAPRAIRRPTLQTRTHA
ncbi:TIGR01777 family oxidoreductase [Novosphingobium sp. G106]|uniref:TIGR01777 family oxidoreductase n=1 Tax=Novosphingobium sp. G106 TaxID=2849500 RepID=UPI001C2D16CF|nr:TIGR01777 family oxidoreductase [Novosphingobium sp. G106]MBV1691041.1 TIGR01777 family oxidoreductase [Novosphingobium sp. G106]